MKRLRPGLQLKLASALCIAMTAVLGTRAYLNFSVLAEQQHELNRQEMTRLQQTFSTLVERSGRELFRYGHQHAVVSDKFQATASTLPLSLHSAIDSASYLSLTGKVLASGDLGDAQSHPSPERISYAVGRVRALQQPVAFIDCRDSCYQHAFIPLITPDNQEVIVNLNRSAALLVEDFYRLTHAEIVLYRSPDLAQESDADQATIALASHSQMTKGLLEQLGSVDTLTPSETVWREVGDQTFSIEAFTLSNDNGTPHRVVVLKDQSALAHRYAVAQNQILLSSLITLLVMILVVYLICEPALRRLIGITTLLKQLPNFEFEPFRRSLKKVGRSRFFPDEIDQLKLTLTQVSFSLQNLDETVNEQRVALNEKVQSLEHQSRFVQTLLDNSPMVIIVSDSRGKVLTANQLASRLVGVNDASGLAIDHWLPSTSTPERLHRRCHLLPGGRFQQEQPLTNVDGDKVELLWIHTTIDQNDQTLFLSVGVDLTERKQAAESLSWLGEHDRVTGLLNRSTFIEKARDHVHHHGAEHSFSLLMLDIDDFAQFNDRFGFSIGDRLLAKLALHLVEHLPSSAMTSRTGSGEFCALLSHQKHQTPQDVVANLFSLNRYHLSMQSSEEEVSLSVVVEPMEDGSSDIEAWLSDVTDIMVRVKQKAKGTVYCADPNDTNRVAREEKYRIKGQILDALAEDRLQLFYQPIVNVSENRVSHCECLVRMRDTEGNIVPPNVFLPVAAQTGLISRIDYAVMEMAMTQQSRWQKVGIDCGLSINLTAPTIEQQEFQLRLEQLLSKTGANPERLIFEVVETDSLENIAIAKHLLENFRKVGAKIALDDFGVGFTSFEYVRELPVDFIKIDQSFIRFLHEREEDQQLVKSMVEMSHKLGKRVIVEGLETSEALAIVRSLGVEYIQGYYLAKPQPLSSLDLSIKLPPEDQCDRTRSTA